MNEVLVLPDAVHHNVARESLQQRARTAIGGPARIGIRMDNAGPANEPAGVAEIVSDPGEQTAQTPHAVLNRELAQPERRGLRHAAQAGATAGELQVQPKDVSEDEPAVELRHAIVIAAFDPISVDHPDPRAVAHAALRPENRENRIVAAARRSELLIDCREQSDVRPECRSRELRSRHWLHDAARVDQILRHLK